MNTNNTHQKGVGFLPVLLLVAIAGLGVVAAQQYTQSDTSPQELFSTTTEESLGEVSENSAEDKEMTEEADEREESSSRSEEQTTAEVVSTTEVVTDSGQRAVVTLAGGCFWCTEAYIQETPGVVDAISGYAGGSAETATYKQVSTGKTGHKEAVQVTYDPVRISFKEILEVYWSHIDPTDAGGQFADRGSEYKTAIFYHTDEQRRVAEESKAALAASGLFDQPIATEILQYTTFYEAEEYHQDYYKKASDHYERYKKASGRSGFIDDNWAKEAALQFFEEQESAPETVSTSMPSSDVYVEREWSDSEIQAALNELPADVYKIVAEDGTERSFQNEYYDFKGKGIYVDVVTGRPLYSSTHKYDSGTGWPAFYRPIDEANMIYETDYKLIAPRTEVRSESGHLGHVFNDGPDEFGGKRHCINSLALDFVPYEEMVEKGYAEYMYLFN